MRPGLCALLRPDRCADDDRAAVTLLRARFVLPFCLRGGTAGAHTGVAQAAPRLGPRGLRAEYLVHELGSVAACALLHSGCIHSCRVAAIFCAECDGVSLVFRCRLEPGPLTRELVAQGAVCFHSASGSVHSHHHTGQLLLCDGSSWSHSVLYLCVRRPSVAASAALPSLSWGDECRCAV